MARLSLSLLGPPLIELDGQPVQLGRHKATALLAYLALDKQVHSRDALAAMFWPDLDQSGARAEVRRTLSLINRTLGSQWLDVDRENAGWMPDADAWLDVDALRELLAACATHGHPADDLCPECIPLLTQAVALYRDGFLAGFTLPDAPGFDEWQFFEGEGLRDQVAGALQRLAHWHEGHTEHETAIAYARRWLALDPTHESAHRALMRLYAQSGQRSAALRQYGECERLLAQELGMSPDGETTALYQAIRERRELPPTTDDADQETGFLSKTRFLNNLPAQLTPFIGREQELAELDRLLADRELRLVTVLGPGGSGKTRLAMEAASRQVGRYADGVWFVSLAPVQSADGMVSAIAQAIGLSFYGEAPPRQQLFTYLGRRRMLLVLDNYEHLVSPSVGAPVGGSASGSVGSSTGGASLLVDLLRAAPGVDVLVTSRIWLNLVGEQVFALGGMDYAVPATETAAARSDDLRRLSAVVLFQRCARRAWPGFELSETNLPHVARVCRLVEGMPLAILLAAAWVPALAVAEIADEVERGLDFLVAEWGDEPERHHSMRAVFDATWAMLSESEQKTFVRLSVFRGGFTREAAQAVAGADLRTLASLVSKSLLQRERTGRYHLHELLRQYGEAKLDKVPEEKEKTLDLHAAYYTTMLAQWEPDLRNEKQEVTLSRMDVEIDNAQAAWEWAVSQGNAEWLNRALIGLFNYYDCRERQREAEPLLEMATASLDAAIRDKSQRSASPLAKRALAKMLAWQAEFGSEHELDREPVERCRTLLADPALTSRDARQDRAYVLSKLAVSLVQIDFEQARAHLVEALALYQALGNSWGIAQVLQWQAFAAWLAGNYDQARQDGYESLERFRSLGNPRGVWWSLAWLMTIANTQGELEELEQLRREHDALARAFGDPGHAASVHLSEADLCVLEGKYTEADAQFGKCVDLHRELGTDIVRARVTAFRCMASLWAGASERARHQAHLVLDAVREKGVAHLPLNGRALFVLGALALARGEWAQAQSLFAESIDVFGKNYQGDSMGQVWGCLFYADYGLGRYVQARQHLTRALRIADKTRGFRTRMVVLSATAVFLADQGEAERAVELYALALRHPFVANSGWFKDVAGQHIAAAAATLPNDVIAAAQARGRARDLEATIRELLAELAHDTEDTDTRMGCIRRMGA